MNRSRKIFILFAIVFFLALAYASYDISKRTTFPGSKSQLKERIKKNYRDDPRVDDSLTIDTTLKKIDKTNKIP